MKINKNTMITCAVITLISGCAVLFFDNTLIQNIAPGIFTGFLVSLVVSVIGYFHERNVILEKTDGNIKCLYINMCVLSKILGDVLPQIHRAVSMEQLPFKTISGLSELNVEFAGKMDIGLFSPICKKGILSKTYVELTEFQQTLYNIKNISADLQMQTMKFTIVAMQLQNAQYYRSQIKPTDADYAEDLKNLINIRTAKLHEYVTGQMLELDKIAESFFSYKSRKYPWKEIKKNLMKQVEDIVKE